MANLFGNGWSALISIATIPVYIHFMGIESYALIGIYVTLVSISAILDFGMSTTLNREMARLTSLPGKAQEVVNLVRTMEIINWIIAVFIGLLIFSLSHFIAYSWVKPGILTAETVREAVCLMGLSMVFQWPFNFYSGGFIGLQKQELLNVITAGMTTFRSVGAIFILWFFSPTIQAFLIWHIVINVLQFVILAVSLKIKLPAAGKPAAFQLDLVYRVWSFAAGVGGISILSMIMSQMDKFILSWLLTLEIFGYYTLAGVVATSSSRLIVPIVNAIWPRLTELIALEEIEGLKKVYHGGCQLMSVLIMPSTLLLVFFSKEILLLWTQNPVTAEKTFTLVAFLALAMMFSGLSLLPQALQYALGRTKVVFYAVLVTLIVMAPAIIITTRYFGVVGTAAALMMINMIYALSSSYLYHGDILPEERRYWYVKDIGIPLFVAITVMGMGRLLIQGNMSSLALGSSLIIITALTISAVAYSAPATREWLIGRFRAPPKEKFNSI